MVWQKIRQVARASNQSVSAIKCVDVTGLSESQRRSLVVDCMNRGGFMGVIKHKASQQVYYSFKFRKCS